MVCRFMCGVRWVSVQEERTLFASTVKPSVKVEARTPITRVLRFPVRANRIPNRLKTVV